MSVTPPEKVPEKGFYYHYKHDPSGAVNNYAYEMVGVGHHTEDYASEQDKYLVVYRPIYEASVYKAGKLFDIRPLYMWLEEVEKDGKKFPRFARITDSVIIAELEKIKAEMYND